MILFRFELKTIGLNKSRLILVNKKYNLYDNLSDDACKVRLLFNYFEGDKSISEISKTLHWDFKKTLSWTNKFLEKGLIKKIEIK